MAALVVALAAILVASNPALADLGEKYRSARKEFSAGEAKARMERILGSDENGDVAAEAGVWLGQYEYALGRLATALGYFQRAAELAGDPALQARVHFWTDHTRNLLASDPAGGSERSPEDETDPAGANSSSDTAGARSAQSGGRNARPLGPAENYGPAMTYQVLAELARGDERTRRGELSLGVRSYLEAEGRARDTGCLGPLAYRAALGLSQAREVGKKDPLFDPAAVESWDEEIFSSAERGLVFATLRSRETIAPPKDRGTSEFASHVSGNSEGTAVESRKWGDGVEGILDPGQIDRGPPNLRERQVEPRLDLFVLQLGAYRDRNRARTEMERLTSRGLSVRLERGFDADGDRVFRIRLGAASSRQQAQQLADRVLEGLPYQLVPVEP